MSAITEISIMALKIVFTLRDVLVQALTLGLVQGELLSWYQSFFLQNS